MNINELDKTISKIENAKNITDHLLYRTSTVAEFIRKQMESLGLNEVLAGKYIINEVRACGQSFSLFSLQVTDNDLYEYPVSLVSNEVSSSRKLNFIAGDFDSQHYLPNRHDVLTFIQDLPAIFSEISKYETSFEIELLDNILRVIDTHQKAA